MLAHLLDFTASQDWLVWLMVALPVVGFFFPGCTCCGCQYADRFNRADNSDIGSDWTVESGTWSISGDRLVYTGGTPGQIIWNNESSRSDDGMSVAIQLIGDGATTVYDQVIRLYVRYVDEDNYLAVEWHPLGSSLTTDWADLGWIAIQQKHGGVLTEERGTRGVAGLIHSGLLFVATFTKGAGAEPDTLSGQLIAGTAGYNLNAFAFEREVTDTGGTKGGFYIDDADDATFDDWQFPYVIYPASLNGTGSDICTDLRDAVCGGTLFVRATDFPFLSPAGSKIYARAHARGANYTNHYYQASVGAVDTALGERWRIFFNWLDDSNHHYLKLERTAVSGTSQSLTLSICDAAGTVIASGSHTGNTRTGSNMDVRLCVQGTEVTASLESNATGAPEATTALGIAPFLTVGPATITPVDGGFFNGFIDTVAAEISSPYQIRGTLDPSYASDSGCTDCA